jgi:hypothetical protein
MPLERLPLIVVKRCYWDDFRAGTKTIEYRRHKRQFTARVYYPGRRVRIAYNYNLALHPTLMATVKRFEVALASVHPEMLDFYQGLRPSDEIALIHLQVEKGA